MVSSSASLNSRPKVLLVDDYEGNLLALEIPLRGLACEVVQFTSGHKALEYLEANEVAVILLDVKMPVIDGFEVARRARQIPTSNATPIIFITGTEQNDQYIDRMAEVGGFDFIYKPVNTKIVSSKVSFFVDLYRKSKELEEKTTLLREHAELEKESMLENALDAVVAINERNEIIFWNKNAENIFGWAKAEALGQKMSMIVPERFRDAHRAGMKRFLQTGISRMQNRRIEIPGLRKNGEEFLLELTISSVNARGEYRFFSFMRDISEQKRVQELIKSSEQTLAQIFDQSLSMMVVLRGPDLIFERANAKYFDFLGRRDILGKSVRQVLPEVEADGFLNVLEEVYRTQKAFIGTEVPMAMRLPGASGRQQYFNFVYQPLLGPDGAATGIVGLGQEVTDQVLARRRLEDAERNATAEAQKLSLITNAIPDFIAYVDSDEKYQFANDAHEVWFGNKVVDVIGRSVKDVIGDAYIHTEPQVRQVLLGQEVRFQSKFQPSVGPVRQLDARYIPDQGPDNKVRGFVIVAHDITELQESREDQEFRANLISTLNAAGDLNTLIACATKSVAEHLGVTRCFVTEVNGNKATVRGDFSALGASLQGEFDLMSFGPELVQSWKTQHVVIVADVARDVRTLAHATSHQAIGIFSFITVSLMRGGELVGAMNIADNQPRRWSEREIELLKVVSETVWAAFEHARLMDALRLSTKRSEFLAKASRALNTSLEVEKILLALSDITVPELADWCSIRMTDSKGALKQVAVSHHDPEKVKWAWDLQERFPPDPESKNGPFQVLRSGRPELLRDITDEMIVKGSKTAAQAELLRSIGMRSYICVPIFSRDRAVGTLTLVTTDESSRRYSEEDLNLGIELGVRAGIAVENARLYLEARAVNRLKDEFLANLSHELRTPMNVIQGHAEILKSEVLTMTEAELSSSVEAIERNAKAQTAIIADLLDVSSIITGKVSYKPTKIQPAKTVVEILNGLAPTATAKGVRLLNELSEAPKFVSADSTRLHQIVWNLVSNAIKFTDAGGTVSVNITHSKDEWTLRITDTGRGIDADFLPYVFDRFRQEDASTTRRFGGLGLGLSIVRHLVELHGGYVKAESPGRGLGSTFKVTLPLDVALAAAETTEKKSVSLSGDRAAASSFDLRGAKILLLEDSLDGRELIHLILARAGAEVVDAESASEARQKLEEFTPDLILSDIGLPEENGIEFITRLRASGVSRLRKIPAIALTAYVREEERGEALAAGFQAHVGKPVSTELLLGAIEKLLRPTLPPEVSS